MRRITQILQTELVENALQQMINSFLLEIFRQRFLTACANELWFIFLVQLWNALVLFPFASIT
jgi:hypothetical protein